MDTTLLTWGLGTCVAGFFVLLALHGTLNEKVERLYKELNDKVERLNVETNVELERRVTYEWLDGKLEKVLFEINSSIKTLMEAFIGTVEKKGIITKMHEHEDKLADLEVENNFIAQKIKELDKERK